MTKIEAGWYTGTHLHLTFDVFKKRGDGWGWRIPGLEIKDWGYESKKSAKAAAEKMIQRSADAIATL
jgi:hypothetical protein